MKKIILIDNENLTIRRRELFCIDQFIEAGFTFEFWDISQLIVDVQICDQLSESYLRKFDTLDQLQQALAEEDTKNAIFIVELWYNWETRKILKLIKKNNCFTVRVNLYAKILSQPPKVPHLSLSLDTLKFVYKKAKQELSYVAFKIYCALNSMNRKFDYCISSDSRRKSTQTLINHPDWVRAKAIERAPKSAEIPEKPYIVFIDQFYPLHPDFKRGFVGRLGDADNYQRQLNIFFDKIERDLGYDVIVAAHPKAEYNHDTFNGRKIIKYKSEELVKYSQGVLLHTSLAISYILIFNKPIMLITNSEHCKTSKLMLVQQHYEEFLKLKTFNVEQIEKVEPSMFVNVDREIRDKYIYSILTSKPIEERTNAEILIETFKNL